MDYINNGFAIVVLLVVIGIAIAFVRKSKSKEQSTSQPSNPDVPYKVEPPSQWDDVKPYWYGGVGKVLTVKTVHEMNPSAPYSEVLAMLKEWEAGKPLDSFKLRYN